MSKIVYDRNTAERVVVDGNVATIERFNCGKWTVIDAARDEFTCGLIGRWLGGLFRDRWEACAAYDACLIMAEGLKLVNS